MSNRRSILVTGSHRSGTTWVGKMLAVAKNVHYIHEPFSPNKGVCYCGSENVYWFTYVTAENEALYHTHMKHLLGDGLNVMKGFKGVTGSTITTRKLVKEYRRFFSRRLHLAVPLIKDPIAFFSAEWLAQQFDMNVVVLIRHPAAFVSSLKRLNWVGAFTHLVEQPQLMSTHLQPFAEQITAYAHERPDIIDEAILLWKIIHSVIVKYQNEHKDWIFVRHEDISGDALNEFQPLFAKLDLNFTPQVREVIQNYSASSNPSEAPEGGNSIRRNSKDNIWNWKNRLTEAEIERIREQVQEISQVFYKDSDW